MTNTENYNLKEENQIVLFIDMNLKEGHSISLAKEFRNKNPYSYICFISSYKNHREMISMQKKSFYFFYKFSSFEKNIEDFLLKIKRKKLKNEILEIEGNIKISLQKDHNFLRLAIFSIFI